MNVENIVISACITVFSAGLFGIAFASFRKYHNTKLLFVSCIFLVLLCKGLLMSLSIFIVELAPVSTMPYSGLFDLVLLLVLFVATLKG